MGIGIAVALYVSDRRARTDADHYIYSPRYKPRTKTPKLAFVPLPLVVATLFVTLTVRDDIWKGQLNAVAYFICTAILWLCFIGALAFVFLLTLTSRPVGKQPADTSAEEPLN
ncbi:MAG: hypothetical protein ACXVDI_08200 [Ktedonobacterales bacterium]